MGILSSQIAVKKLVPLCRQLATTYEAGIPLLRCFDVLKRELKDPQLLDLLTAMQDSIRVGSTLADAFRAESKYFPPYMIEAIAAGEVGGKLDAILNDLADYFEDRLEMRRAIIKAMAYPAILLVLAWFVGTFALRLVVQVVGFVASGTGRFDFMDYVRDYVVFQGIAMGIVGLVALGCIVLSRRGLFGWVWGLVATHLWPLSPITRRFGLARFFRSMALLIAGGLPIQRCIERSAAVTANPYMERDLLKAVPLVKQGTTLAEAFSRSRYLLPTAREMLYVGEQSGKLEAQLRKVSEYYMSEASHAVDVALKLLYVVIYLAVAALIGYIVISFYAGYYGTMLDTLG